MAKKVKEQHAQVKQIVQKTFSQEVNTVRVQEIKEDIINYYFSKYGNDSVSASFQFDDAEVIHWKKNEHFYKVFHHELRHVEEYYSLSRGEKHFITDIAEFLMWEMNLLVDEESKPLNQKRLAEKLGIHPKTVRENMKSLEEKRIIHAVELRNEVFYYVNPYIVFCGKDININIYRLFDELGYVNCNMISGKSRSHRKKEQQKRLKIN